MSSPSSQATPRLPLGLRDTPDSYGRVSRLLHWGMAALILWQFLGKGLQLLLGRTPLVGFFTSSHAQVGTVLMALILLRVVWAVVNRGSRPGHGRDGLGQAARIGHLALYGLMLVVPLVALLRAFGSTRAFAPFGFEMFAAREPAIGWMVGLGNALHGVSAWLLLALILGHVVMVGLHERLWHDGTLARMLGRA